MGQTLSEPVTDKISSHGEAEKRLAYGVSEMQGWRLTMEDAHATELSLDTSTSPSQDDLAFFAVYDGHGGSTVAKFAGDTLHHRLRSLDSYKAGKYEEALKRVYLGTDEDLRSNPDYQADPSGCTAVSAIIAPDRKIYVANAGDSRAVMSVGGEAKPLSYDHKPVNKTENSRIVAAGGFVEFGRVNGNLALSRALGDFEFKQNDSLPAEAQIVTADPDITVHDPTEEDEFMIIACDGIWDVVTSQQSVDFVRRAVADRVELAVICERLMDRCLAPDSDWGGVGCDNMTLLVVALLRGKTLSEWYNWVADRVARGVGYKTPDSIPDPYRQAQKGGIGAAGRGRGRGGGQSALQSILANAVSGSGGGLSLQSLTGEDNNMLAQALGGRGAMDESDDDDHDMGAAQAALRQNENAADDDVAMADADEDVTPSANTPTTSHVAKSVNPGSDAATAAPHSSPSKGGLMDKSDDPTKGLA